MRPLDGVRVVDASSFLTGPFAAMMLGDLGADIVKVEPPRGDTFRRFGKQHNGHGISFANTNRNKRSVVLDLRLADDRAAFDDLLGGADVLFTNWRPATTRALGFDEEVTRRHPRLVWVRISGFGQDGPAAELPAFDSVIQASSGLAFVQGDERPTLVQSWICDKVTAMFAAQAALSGMIERVTTGRGALIDLPMLDALAYFNFPDLMVERTVLPADGPALNTQLRANRPVPTRDGWMLVSPVGGRQLKQALAALGCPERAAEFRSIADPGELTETFYRLAEAVTPQRSTAEWLEVLQAHDVPAAAVLDLDTHLTDPQVRHNGIYEERDDPHLGRVRSVHHPFARGPARPFPLLDQHHSEVLDHGWPA